MFPDDLIGWIPTMVYLGLGVFFTLVKYSLKWDEIGVISMTGQDVKELSWDVLFWFPKGAWFVIRGIFKIMEENDIY